MKVSMITRHPILELFGSVNQYIKTSTKLIERKN